MQNPMIRFAIVALVFAAVARADSPATKPGMDDGQVAHLSALNWVAPKAPEIPKGAMVAGVAGDPATGPSVAYAKFPAGFAFPAHSHSATEYTVLISGKATFTVDGKSSELVPGSYIVIPAKAPHYLVCGAGAECVVITRRAGAQDYNWIKK
jgi:quercetin dioxygenase-like cupin family protein